MDSNELDAGCPERVFVGVEKKDLHFLFAVENRAIAGAMRWYDSPADWCFGQHSIRAFYRLPPAPGVRIQLLDSRVRDAIGSLRNIGVEVQRVSEQSEHTSGDAYDTYREAPDDVARV